MIIVTGGAGFIGSNIVHALNQRDESDILVVDDLSEGRKFFNLVDCRIRDYRDKDDFLNDIINEAISPKDIKAIFHQGACSSTTEWDGRMMMRNNYEYSKVLLHFCLENRIPFIYASSAATYGAGQIFTEEPGIESPLNVYGYSKSQFDHYVRRVLPFDHSQVVGLRYFNVYGPREQHKGSMASVAYHFNRQVKDTGKLKLFEGTEGYANGEQRRDFVFIDDVVAVNLWFLENPKQSGIFNVGTGRSQTFNEVAAAVVDWHGRGEIEYIPFPDHLKGSYQSFTEADITALRDAGYDQPFQDVATGVKKYLDRLKISGLK